MRSRLWAIYASLTWSCIACTGAFADDVTYSYDALGRLVRVEYASGSTIVYNYDSAGNRTSVVYNGTNGAPVANADSISTTLNRAITFDPRANDSDPDNDPLTISNTPTASHGTVTNNSGQTLTYTPATGFPSGNTGTDFFNYTISDGRGNTAQARVTVSITDRPPVAVPDTVGVPNGTVTTFKPLNNDSDPDSDTLTITSPTGTPMTTNAGGSVVRSGKSLIYTPPINTPPNGEADTFSYTISDGHNNTAMATETMNIGAQNQAPTAHDDTAAFSATAAPRHPIAPYVQFNPLLNDTDPDNDPLTVISVTQPMSGNATVTYSANTVTYQYNTAVQNIDTTDSFTYTISDGHGHTAGPATVTVSLYVETGD